jgi:nitrogen regulatory protein PII
MAVQLAEEISEIVAELNRIGKKNGIEVTDYELPYIVKILSGYKSYERNRLLEDLKLKGLSLEEFREKIQEETTISQIMLSDAEYDRIMSEVMAMPPKKRKNYKSTLTDKNGTKTKLIYDGELKNYSTTYNRFLPVIKNSTIEGGKVISKVGYEVLVNKKNVEEVMEKVIEENHTGNHEGRVNYRVKVPAPCCW